MIHPRYLEYMFSNLEYYWRKEIVYEFEPLSEEQFTDFSIILAKLNWFNCCIENDNYILTNGELRFMFRANNKYSKKWDTEDNGHFKYKCYCEGEGSCVNDITGRCYDCSLTDFKNNFYCRIKYHYDCNIGMPDDRKCLDCSKFPMSLREERIFEDPKTLFCEKHCADFINSCDLKDILNTNSVINKACIYYREYLLKNKKKHKTKYYALLEFIKNPVPKFYSFEFNCTRVKLTLK